MKEWIWLVVVFLVIVVGAFITPKLVKDYEVIEPEKGIKCIVVSRLMHTSVDCWRECDK